MKYSIVKGNSVVHGDMDYNYHPEGAVINEDETLTASQILALGAKQDEARSMCYTAAQIAAVKVDDIIINPNAITAAVVSTKKVSAIGTKQVASVTTTQI